MVVQHQWAVAGGPVCGKEVKKPFFLQGFPAKNDIGLVGCDGGMWPHILNHGRAHG